MTDKQHVKITYFSDVLCIWAYVAQIRIEELKRRFASVIEFDYRYIPLFGNTERKIGRGWEERGGFEGYNRHLKEILLNFDHVEVHPEIWIRNQPASSAGVHLFLKAVHLSEEASMERGELQMTAQSRLEKAAWQLRLAFFRDCLDIADFRTQIEVAEQLGLPVAEIEERMKNGQAFAALCEDADAQQRHRIEGSPTYLLNEGRQKLFGNVGYRVIEANVQELLRVPDQSQASWC